MDYDRPRWGAAVPRHPLLESIQEEWAEPLQDSSIQSQLWQLYQADGVLYVCQVLQPNILKSPFYYIKQFYLYIIVFILFSGYAALELFLSSILKIQLFFKV